MIVVWKKICNVINKQFRRGYLIPILFIAGLVFYIWCYRFLPLQDYPDWLLQGKLFLDGLKGDLSKEYEIINYPVPNSISTFLIALLDIVFRAEVSGKILLSMYILMFALSSLYMLSSNDKNRYSFLYFLPLLLIVNEPFFHGNINYVIGLSVLFAGCGYVARANSNVKTVYIAIVSIIAYYSHAITFIIWLIYLYAYAVYHKNAIRKIFIGSMPSLVLVLIYGVNHLLQPGISENRLIFNLPGIENTIQYFSIFNNFIPFWGRGNSFIATINVINHGFGYLILGIASWWALKVIQRHDNEEKYLILVIFVCLLSYFLCPDYFYGIVSPRERFLFPCFWFMLMDLMPKSYVITKRTHGILKSICIGLLFLQTGYLYLYAGAVSNDLAISYFEIKRYDIGEFDVIAESHFNFEDQFENNYHPPFFMASHDPLMRLPYYLGLESREYIPIFSTGIIRDKRTNMESIVKEKSLTSLQHDKLAPRIYVMGTNKGNDYIFSKIKDRYSVLYKGKYCAVLNRTEVNGD